jgi:Mycoplasma protein of unknown function, DUF285/Secretion system C-terminal sorting domain
MIRYKLYYIYTMKKVLLLLFIQFNCLFCLAQQIPFVSVWDLSKPGGLNTEIVFQFNMVCIQNNWNFNYYWETIPAGLSGNGFLGTSNNTIYGLPANATVKVSFFDNNICFIELFPSIDKLRLIDIPQWGQSIYRFNFKGCNNLNISATDTPALYGSFKDMFAMDSGINVFTGPANINAWNVSKAEDMSGMFKNCNLFNQSLSNWDVSRLRKSDSMFAGASSFNQSLDTWDVHRDTSMRGMFAGASAFNQNLGSWQLHPSIKLQGMLDSCGMDCAKYSSTLYGWASQATKPINKTLGAAGLSYGINAQQYKDTLVANKGWTIVGDTLGADTCCFATTLMQIACDSFYFNGQSLTTSGTYYDTIANPYGCDTIITLHLTIRHSTSSTVSVSKCPGQNYIMLGNTILYHVSTYTVSGIYPKYYINAAGCDSIFYLNVTVNPVYKDTIDVELCKAILFNNKYILYSGYYKDTFKTIGGCDSFITMHVTQKFPSYSSFFATACESYLYNDTLRTKSGFYKQYLTNAAGCDSVRELSLIINSPGKDTIKRLGSTLSSSYINAVYQWVQCNNYAPINGATSKTYSPTSNGSYAVITSISFCKDTSNCVTVSNVGLQDQSLPQFTVAPNPIAQEIIVRASNSFEDARIIIFNTVGQILLEVQHVYGTEKRIDLSNVANGLYMMQINDKHTSSLVKFVKDDRR